ncbi:MAG: HIT family protein [Kiritimatiellae bacterium]|nr:HIT family protein [Kiritimatiellia bacterium]
MSNDCIFCNILAGGIPAATILENDDILAFLDIGPIVKGHTLVIPKQHVETIHEISTEQLNAVMIGVQQVAAALVKALGAEGVNITQANGAVAGQVVPHLHFHVIPRYADDGHHWNWNAKSYDSPEEMGSVKERIIASMGA